MGLLSVYLQCECGNVIRNFASRQIELTCKCGMRLSVAPHQVEVKCNKERTPSQTVSHEPSRPLEELLENQRLHWRALHTFPFSDKWSCENRCKWWKQWNDTIPNVNCDCRRHWRELVEEFPPVFTSREAFFEWSVKAHNRVNVRLGKPEVSLKEATAMYLP